MSRKNCIIKKDIEKNLNELDKLYNLAFSTKSDQSHLIFYSKLAVIEYCGWLEHSIDLIILRAMKNKLKELELEKILNESIRLNYGFSYDNNFRKLLINSIGLEKTDRLIRYLKSNNSYYPLQSHLNTLKAVRNKAAHTYYTEGAAISYDSPSVVKGYLVLIYPIFKDIYKYLSEK